MIHAVVILCVLAGISAIPVQKDYYPKSGCGHFGCSQGTHVIQQQGIIGGVSNNGFDARFVGFDGRNAAASASSAATSGFDATASASAVSGNRGFAGHPGVIGLNSGFGFNGVNPAAAAAATAVTSEAERTAFLGNTGFQATAPYNGPIGHQVSRINYPSGPLVQPIPSVHYPTNQILGQTSGVTASATSLQGAAASSAATGLASGATHGSGIGMGAVLGPQFTSNVGVPVLQPIPSVQFPTNNVFGQNTGASASSAAIGGSTSLASAAASSANIGSGIRMDGVIGPEFPNTFGGPVIHPGQGVYYPQNPVVGQTSASSAAAAAAVPNGASAASAAVVGSQGFSDGQIIRRTSGIIGNIIPRRKTY
ncbi:elastin-like [Saccostrea echinata]|uniref:elastin-like n=1 Tax=Saccostrea echinata TaxID=191078 RepID=UPI002A82FDE9|nr:elastin-like [Saccostrea echinata]